MNNKGFTLVELLAVIVILSLLALLATTSVTKLLHDSKKEISNIQEGQIKEAVITWSADNLSKLPGEDSCKYITVGDLKEYGLLESKELSDDIKIKLTSRVGKDGNLITDYEVNPNSVDSCIYVYEPIIQSATLGNRTLAGKIPQGNFALGDEYIINVDGIHKYHFYVLSEEGDKVNLIMSNNICSDGTLATVSNKCLVAWVSKTDYNDDINYGGNGNNNKGPITVMNYLHEVTKNWSNIENIQMDYTDEGNTGSYGYGTIKTNGNTTKITMKDGTETAAYINLKARLPKLSEITGTGCTSDSGSCPTWMVNGLSTYTDKYPTGTKEDIENIYGYWSLSSYTTLSINARSINCDGTASDLSVYIGNHIGLRPVISVSKSNMPTLYQSGTSMLHQANQ